MSLLSKYVFDPIKAMLGQKSQSSNPVIASTATAALAAVVKTGADVTADLAQPWTSNTPAGVGNTLIGDLEDGLKNVVDAFVTASADAIPVVGGVLAPEAVNLSNIALTFAEQHVHAYVSGLFQASKEAIAAKADPASVTLKPPG